MFHPHYFATFKAFPDPFARRGKWSVTDKARVLLLFFLISAMGSIAQAKNDSDVLRKPNQLAGPSMAPPIVITAPMAVEVVGTTFVVPITASDITGDNIVSFQFDIQYDHSIMYPSGPNFGCSTAGTIMSGFNVTCNVITNGTLLVTANTGGAFVPTGSGPMLNLTFTAQPTTAAGDISPLTFVPATAFVFNNLGIFPRTVVNGQVRFREPTAGDAMISGQARNQDARPLANVRVLLTAPNGTVRMALTNPFGYFRFFDVPVGENYIISAQSKRYTFAPQLVPVGEEIADLALVSDQ